jgi:hypothetical protein
MADNNNPTRQSGFPPRQRWVEIALIVVVFFAAAGVPVPSVNETHYLTKAKHYWNPDWCAGDLFLESADAHLTFYWAFGILTKWLSLPVVAWVGRFIAWVSLAWAWQRLSSQVVPVRWLSVVTAMLLVTLIEQTNFAGEWIVGGIEGKCFAYVFVIWALSEMVVGRWQWVWPLLGIASAFHVLVGGWSVVCAGAVWLFEPRESRQSFSSMLPALFVGGVFALPGIVPGIMLTHDVPAEIRDEANQIYVFKRLPHHLAIHYLPRHEIITRFVRFGLLLAVFVALWNWNSLRPTSEQTKSLDRLERFALVSIVICMLGLSWELATVNHPALSASLLKYYWYRTSDIAVPLVVAISCGALVTALTTSRSSVATWIIASVVLGPGFLLLSTATDRWQELTPVESHTTSEALSWRDICGWARNQTDSAALFMIPRQASTFRWYAERPVFFAWKDIPQDASSQIVWWDRYNEAYFGSINEFGEQIPYGSLQELGVKRLLEIAARHDIDYILTSEYPPLPLKVAYENPQYKIYDVRSEDSKNE